MVAASRDTKQGFHAVPQDFQTIKVDDLSQRRGVTDGWSVSTRRRSAPTGRYQQILETTGRTVLISGCPSRLRRTTRRDDGAKPYTGGSIRTANQLPYIDNTPAFVSGQTRRALLDDGSNGDLDTERHLRRLTVSHFDAVDKGVRSRFAPQFQTARIRSRFQSTNLRRRRAGGHLRQQGLSIGRTMPSTALSQQTVYNGQGRNQLRLRRWKARRSTTNRLPTPVPDYDVAKPTKRSTK